LTRRSKIIFRGVRANRGRLYPGRIETPPLFTLDNHIPSRSTVGIDVERNRGTRGTAEDPPVRWPVLFSYYIEEIIGKIFGYGILLADLRSYHVISLVEEIERERIATVGQIVDVPCKFHLKSTPTPPDFISVFF